ncbi:hypothetical protein RJ640_007305 [Escallonia rubra]|uniref:Uncharacterized protein n=1 Tax=Escallonia rubra TaxID=112253 RepID=A0AA88RSN4_9ASTE|nr:hypothetical protein RJ640_007305 [Escallonia rubra]
MSEYEEDQAIDPDDLQNHVKPDDLQIMSRFVLFLMGFDDHKALAFGPEGPLMEDFWDNMRRYGLYALTSCAGVT